MACPLVWAAITITHLIAFFQSSLGKLALKGKSILDINEARNNRMAVASAGPLCKPFAPCSMQITTPAPHLSIFYRIDALPDAQPTVSKH